MPAASVASWLSFDANTTEQALWRDLSFLLGGDAEAKKLLPILWGITEAGFRSWPSATRINALKHALNRVYQGIFIIFFVHILFINLFFGCWKLIAFSAIFLEIVTLEASTPPRAPMPAPTSQTPGASAKTQPFTVACALGHISSETGSIVPAPSTGTAAQVQLRNELLYALQGQHELKINVAQALILRASEVTSALWNIESPLVAKGTAVLEALRVELGTAEAKGEAKRGSGTSVAKAAATLVEHALSFSITVTRDPSARSYTLSRTADGIHDTKGRLFPPGSPLRDKLVATGVLLGSDATTVERTRLAGLGYDPFDPSNPLAIDLLAMPGDVTVLEAMHAVLFALDQTPGAVTFYNKYLAPGSAMMRELVAMATLPADQRATVVAERRTNITQYGVLHPDAMKECSSIAARVQIAPYISFSARSLLDSTKSIAQAIETASQVTANAALVRYNNFVIWHVILHVDTDMLYSLSNRALCRDVQQLFSDGAEDRTFPRACLFLQQHAGPAYQFSVGVANAWFDEKRASLSYLGPNTTAFHHQLCSALESDLNALSQREISLPPRLVGESPEVIATARGVTGVYRNAILGSFPLPTTTPVHAVNESFFKLTPSQLVDVHNYLQGRPPRVANMALGHCLGFFSYQEPVANADVTGDVAITQKDRAPDLAAVVGFVVSVDAANKIVSDGRLRDHTRRLQNVLLNVSDPHALVPGAANQGSGLVVGSARLTLACPRPHGKEGCEDDGDEDGDENGKEVTDAAKDQGLTDSERIEQLLQLSAALTDATDSGNFPAVSDIVDRTWEVFAPGLVGRTTGFFSNTSLFKPIVGLLQKVPEDRLPSLLALIAHTTTAILFASDPGVFGLV